MQFIIGFLVGVAASAAVAHVYIQKVVNEELTALRESAANLKAAVESKIAEIKSKL